MIHRGELLEKIVRESQHSLTKLAHRLNISRNTLYNRFKDPHLSYRFIALVGEAIRYDFSIHFPELKKPEFKKEDYSKQITITRELPIVTPNKENKSAELWRTKLKYANLMERYRKLMDLLIEIAKQNELTELEQEFKQIKEETVKEVPTTF